HGLESIKLRELVNWDWTVVVQHTYREGNHATDYLASIGYDYPFGSHTIREINRNFGYFLRYNYFGIFETRSVMIND
ncbi:hypothetical protein LINPERPRIM_LOCUS40578, partial [Linum perenne]